MQIQSAIKLDRTYDVYWLNPPQRRVRIIKNRREKYWGTQTRMPIILRNLAPETTFDPRVTWDREKEAEAAEAAEEAALAEAAGGDAKKPAKGGKAKKPSKADEMRAANEKKQVEDSIRRDWEKLDNAAKGAKKGDTRAVLTVKPATPEGKLRQMLLILKEGLDGNDHPMLFDVLWAIEAHKVYKRVLAEEADADDAKDDKKGGKDDKKDKKGKDEKTAAGGHNIKGSDVALGDIQPFYAFKKGDLEVNPNVTGGLDNTDYSKLWKTLESKGELKAVYAGLRKEELLSHFDRKSRNVGKDTKKTAPNGNAKIHTDG